MPCKIRKLMELSKIQAHKFIAICQVKFVTGTLRLVLLGTVLIVLLYSAHHLHFLNLFFKFC